MDFHEQNLIAIELPKSFWMRCYEAIEYADIHFKTIRYNSNRSELYRTEWLPKLRELKYAIEMAYMEKPDETDTCLSVRASAMAWNMIIRVFQICDELKGLAYISNGLREMYPGIYAPSPTLPSYIEYQLSHQRNEIKNEVRYSGKRCVICGGFVEADAKYYSNMCNSCGPDFVPDKEEEQEAWDTYESDIAPWLDADDR